MTRAFGMPLFPEREIFAYDAEIAGAMRRLVFEWKEGTGAWYVSVEGIVQGARVSPGGAVRLGAGRALAFFGRDPYLKEDLGTQALEVYYVVR